ncbi:MAG: DUF177 domain-containing protein [Pseudomonadota bacterium]
MSSRTDPTHGDHADRTIALAQSPHAKTISFQLKLMPNERADIIDALKLSDLRKTSFTGQLEPSGKRDWHLKATLGATVVQPCSATLAPVTTRIDGPVERLYLADYTEPDEAELEMPEDDRQEPLPDSLNLLDLLIEALALAIPDYPRAPDAAPTDSTFAAPGVAPLEDADIKPFAGLAELKKRMEGE